MTAVTHALTGLNARADTSRYELTVPDKGKIELTFPDRTDASFIDLSLYGKSWQFM